MPKPSKKRERSRRQLDLQYVYPLDRDFPIELQKMTSLRPLQAWIAANGREEFQLRLGRVVYVHRSRHHDDGYQALRRQNAPVPLPATIALKTKSRSAAELPYFQRIREACLAIRASLESLESATDRVRLIDFSHWEQIFAIAGSMTKRNPLAGLNVSGALQRLIEMKSFLAALCLAIEIATQVQTAPRGRGRPSDWHGHAAWELSRLWRELSGKAVVTPRAAVKGKRGRPEFGQPSTEFIRLALRMIDPTVTPSQTITAIRNAMSLEKSLGRTSFDKEMKNLRLGSDDSSRIKDTG